MDKDDKLQEPSTVIDESLKPYFTDTFSPGETKEQIRLGNEVATPGEKRTEVRTSFISLATPENIRFGISCKAIRLQVNFTSGGYVGYNDITVNTQDGTWSGVHFSRNAGTVNCAFESGDIPSQAISGIDFIRCVDTSGGGIQVGRINAISAGQMTITWTTTVGLTYNITYIL